METPIGGNRPARRFVGVADEVHVDVVVLGLADLAVHRLALAGVRVSGMGDEGHVPDQRAFADTLPVGELVEAAQNLSIRGRLLELPKRMPWFSAAVCRALKTLNVTSTGAPPTQSAFFARFCARCSSFGVSP
jgi:hypothetical protein